MKLTIDTKEDSKEEIKKAIRMLSAIVGNSEVYTNAPAGLSEKQHSPNIFSDEQSSSGTGSPAQPQSIFGNMFGDSSQPAQQSQPQADEEKQEPDKKPEIQVIDY